MSRLLIPNPSEVMQLCSQDHASVPTLPARLMPARRSSSYSSDLAALGGNWWQLSPGQGALAAGPFSAAAAANGWHAGTPVAVDLSALSVGTAPLELGLTEEYWR